MDLHVLPGDFLMYIFVEAFAGFQSSKNALQLSLAAVLAISVTLKYILTAALVSRVSHCNGEEERRPTPWLVALALIIAFSLPTTTVYLGQIPPNVWHNSTTIFLMPLALGLFWTSYRYLVVPTPRWLWWTIALCALNIAAKPSFYFMFVAVFPIAALLRYRLSAPFWRAGFATLGTITFLGAQYWYIYSSGIMDRLAVDDSHSKSGIGFGFLDVWGFYSSNVFVSLLASLVFPIVALEAYRSDFVGSLLYRYTVGLYAAGIAFYVLVHETGMRQYDANFSWQAVVGSYLLFAVSAALTLRAIRARGNWAFRDFIVGAALLVHVIAGLFYIHRGAFGLGFF